MKVPTHDGHPEKHGHGRKEAKVANDLAEDISLIEMDVEHEEQENGQE